MISIFVILNRFSRYNIYMNNYKKFLGAKIKDIRRNRGYTQDFLSERIGIDPKHLSRIECGKNSPSLDLLYKICSVLKVNPSVLFDESMLKSKQELICDISEILKNEPESDVRKYYKILINFMN